MQPLRFPPNSRKFKGSIQVDGHHLERGALSQSALAIKVVRETLAHTGSTAGFGRQERRPERAAVARDGTRRGEEGEKIGRHLVPHRGIVISKFAQTFFSLVRARTSLYKQKRPESTISAKVTCFF